MATFRWALGVLALVFAMATPALAQQSSAAGRIKVVSGAAFIVRHNATIPAQAGQIVYEAEALRTGPDGSLGVTLTDDTRLSLGPASEVRLDRFVYALPKPVRGDFTQIYMWAVPCTVDPRSPAGCP